MKYFVEIALIILVATILVAINHWFGRQVLALAAVLGGVWFIIATILLTRPPGIPEFISQEANADEQFVARNDVIPKLPWQQRIRYALCVAGTACLLLWLSIALMGR